MTEAKSRRADGPWIAAGGQTLLHDRAGWLSLQLQPSPSPQDCGDPDKDQEGYNGTVRREPENNGSIPPNVTARCTAPASGPGYKNVRGSANVPGGDPISTGGGGIAYPRVTTKNTVRVGPSLRSSTSLGESGYLGMLTNGLH